MTDTTDTPPSEPQTVSDAVDAIVRALMEALHPELERRVREAVTILTHISGNQFMQTALVVNKTLLEQLRQVSEEQHRRLDVMTIQIRALDVQQQVLVEALRDGELHRLFADEAPSPEAREAGV